MIKFKKIFFIILCFFFLCSTNAFAKALMASLEMMIPKSDLIIIGEVGAVSENSWVLKERYSDSSTESVPGSSAEIAVEKVIKGNFQQNKLTVKYLGTKKYWVEDAPTFKEGERAILFLKKIEKNYCSLVRWNGKVIIDARNKVWVFMQDETIKDDKGLDWFMGQDGVKYYAKHLTVDECVEKINKYISEKKNGKEKQI